MKYADIILPLALPKRTYTYLVPDELQQSIGVGLRVEVPFGRSKLYSGIVSRLHDVAPEYTIRTIVALIDEIAITTPQQLKLWDWLSEYYCCTLGEVMIAALPGQLKLSSETKLVFNADFGEDFNGFSDDEYLLSEALTLQSEITLDDARKILQKKTIIPVVQSLVNRGVLLVREDLEEKFVPKKITCVRLCEPYHSDPATLKQAFEQVDSSDKQLQALMAFLTLSKRQPFVLKQELVDKAIITDHVFNALRKKNILMTYAKVTTRFGLHEDELEPETPLSALQVEAHRAVKKSFEQKNVVLLHGVTGSGKTRIYTELMNEVIARGGQVLYLLPEIALTTHFTTRLKRQYGDHLLTYHSKVNLNERVEVWKAANSGKSIIVTARSGIFLPFTNLQLIIVDEEHDPSFKQHDPAPRYHARDAGIYLAALSGAKVLLGTATPSVDTYYNVQQGKYGIVTMAERYSGVQLPIIETINLKDTNNTKQMAGIFSFALIDAIKAALAAGEQVILFQNRRGYAPMQTCQVCGWNEMCQNCDVSLTFHKYNEKMRCHYCGFTAEPKTVCPACGSGKIVLQGFGTEKIEDELSLLLDQARIGRLDLDVASSKSGMANVLNDFEEKRIDILVGTQMITKGLDFDNVGLVGVIGADQMLRFPDFRSGERAFQLLLQVAGRAGRKHKQGKVLIQAFATTHPVLQEVMAYNYQGFVEREMKERQEFSYPPFTRLIHITLRHKDPKVLQSASHYFAKMLQAKLGKRVLGPVIPSVGRVRSYFLQEILLKLEKDTTLIAHTKQLLKDVEQDIIGQKGWTTVQISFDVDPN